MKQLIPLMLVLWVGAFCSSCMAQKKATLVAVPLVHLRAKPHTQPTPGIHDPLQETQLLYGEQVRVIRTENGWSYIEALEQKEFSHNNRWQGYPGWVPEKSLAENKEPDKPTIIVTRPWADTWEDPHRTRKAPWRFALGTRLAGVDMGGLVWRVTLHNGVRLWMAGEDVESLERLEQLSINARRAAIIKTAESLIGTPYYWGGRSVTTGFDCSGLVNMVYRTAGISIPRDAHEQSMKSVPVNQLKPGDLIFLSKRNDTSRAVHVLLYAGNDSFIEGPGTGQHVRRIAAQERFDKPVSQLRNGSIVNEQTITFGSYLAE